MHIFILSIFVVYDNSLKLQIINSQLLQPIIFLILLITQLYFYLIAGKNPGKIPKSVVIKLPTIPGLSTSETTDKFSNSDLRIIIDEHILTDSDMTFNSDSFKRFCKICDSNQPIRSKHCKDCETCIPKYDHHCFWVGQLKRRMRRRTQHPQILGNVVLSKSHVFLGFPDSGLISLSQDTF